MIYSQRLSLKNSSKIKNFKEIKKSIEDIPISSILENWEPSTLEGKCCFHDDSNAGSFKYKDDNKNNITLFPIVKNLKK